MAAHITRSDCAGF